MELTGVSGCDNLLCGEPFIGLLLGSGWFLVGCHPGLFYCVGYVKLIVVKLSPVLSYGTVDCVVRHSNYSATVNICSHNHTPKSIACQDIRSNHLSPLNSPLPL